MDGFYLDKLFRYFPILLARPDLKTIFFAILDAIFTEGRREVRTTRTSRRWIAVRGEGMIWLEICSCPFTFCVADLDGTGKTGWVFLPRPRNLIPRSIEPWPDPIARGVDERHVVWRHVDFIYFQFSRNLSFAVIENRHRWQHKYVHDWVVRTHASGDLGVPE